MLDIRFSRPAVGLEEVVRFYVHREFQIAHGVTVHPVPARATPVIEFDFGDPLDVVLVGKGIRVRSPLAIVVGPQTYRRVEMQLQGTLSSFVIVFQPDGLQRLFSLPVHELADATAEAHSVLGPSMSRLWQTLGDLGSFEERSRVVDEFLLRQVIRSPGANSISKAVTFIVRTGGCVDLPALAQKAGLSPRHFTRRFIEQVGVRPKLFARVVRFQAALERKAVHSADTWTEIAHDFGYFDQMHMIHDFEQLSGGSPKEMLTHLETVFVEPIRRIRSNAASVAPISDARLTL